MDSLTNLPIESQQHRLRAVIEIVNGEIRVFPIVDNDADEKLILAALKFITRQTA